MPARWIYTHVTLPSEATRVVGLVRRDGAALVRLGLGEVGAPGEAGAGPPVEAGASGAGRGRVTVALRLAEYVGVGVATRRVEVRVNLDVPADRGDGLRLPCRWEAVDDLGFSRFDGAFDVRPVPDGGTEVALAGRYEMPAAGADDVAVATERLARRLLRALSGEVARIIDRQAPQADRLAPRRLHVHDLMTPDPVVVAEGASVRAAALLLLHHRVAALPVVDADDRVVGVVSESDLLAREAAPRVRGGVAARDETRRRIARTVGEAASRPALATSPETSVREAARLLLDADVGRLVVLDDRGRAVGILARHDVLRALTRTSGHLEAAVEAELAAAGHPFVRVEVGQAGRISLVGAVASPEAAAAAIAAAAAVDGVVEVDGARLRVEAPVG